MTNKENIKQRCPNNCQTRIKRKSDGRRMKLLGWADGIHRAIAWSNKYNEREMIHITDKSLKGKYEIIDQDIFDESIDFRKMMEIDN